MEHVRQSAVRRQQIGRRGAARERCRAGIDGGYVIIRVTRSDGIATVPSGSVATGSILNLQQSIGNRSLQRILAPVTRSGPNESLPFAKTLGQEEEFDLAQTITPPFIHRAALELNQISAGAGPAGELASEQSVASHLRQDRVGRAVRGNCVPCAERHNVRSDLSRAGRRRDRRQSGSGRQGLEASSQEADGQIFAAGSASTGPNRDHWTGREYLEDQLLKSVPQLGGAGQSHHQQVVCAGGSDCP